MPARTRSVPSALENPWLVALFATVASATATAQSGTWTRTYPPVEPPIVDVVAGSALDAWAANSDGTAFHTTNGGIAWSSSTLPAGSIAAFTTRASFAWGVGQGIHRSADAGASWTTIASTSGLRDVHFASNTHGWVVGDAGRILRSTDGGLSWQSSTSPTTLANWRAVHFATTSSGWIVGAGGVCARTNDGGANWTNVALPTSADLADVVNVDASRAFVAAGDRVWRTIDAGSTWTASALPVGGRAERLSVLGGNWIWAAGSASRIAYSADAGVTWSLQMTAGGPLVHDVAMGDLTRGIAGGDDGRLWRTSDGGATWTLSQGGGSTPARLVTDVVQRGNSNVWASCSDGVILRSTDGGATWTEVQAALATTIFHALDFAADGLEGYAVGKRAGFYPTTSYTLDGGLTWQTTYWVGMYDFEDVDALGGGVALASTTSGMWRTANHGISWTTVSTFPQVDPYGADFVDAQTGFAVGLGAMRTADGGATWQELASFATRQLDVSFSDANHGWSVGEGGSIRRTTDGGLTWTPQSTGVATPTLYSVEAVSNDVAWITGTAGFVARTLDGGATWTPLAPIDSGGAEHFGSWFGSTDHGWIAGYWPNAGLWKREPPTCSVATYCTGKMTHAGLVPAISSSGTPSIGAGSFTVRASLLLPGNTCLLIHSTIGAAATPFLGGLRCVASPFQRLGMRSADVNGVVEYDIALGNVTPGSTRWYQVFQRDPAHPDGTGIALSNGLQATFCD